MFQFHYWSDLYAKEDAKIAEKEAFQFHYWSDLYFARADALEAYNEFQFHYWSDLYVKNMLRNSGKYEVSIPLLV